MSTNSRAGARLQALAIASSRKVRKFERPKRHDGSPVPVSEFFGCNTFGWDLMSQKLPAADVALLREAPPSRRKLTKELADKVAIAAREWAVAKGATHYCHWFHPQTGATAEKHDSFFSFDKDGHAIEEFNGAALMQQEPDASSFPSGGRRSTFEARGYTAWDATSPMFLMETENGLTLCIPSIFISYGGESLDTKAPLLRSLTSVSENATEALHLLGDSTVKHVASTCGPEQEYFVVDKALHDLRPDLIQAGRTVIGRVPPKHQQLADHYFGAIKHRVVNFMMECEFELYKLGVPCKTRHNEVAPSQFEAAPIFEYANIAADHNQLVMEVIKTVARRHDLVAMFHEKPYADMNGSGKHLNWSLADDKGKNLLDPGLHPEENIRFLYFLTAAIKAVHDYAPLLRSSVASAGNDFRLGANEAPPAIMSVFLGDTLTSVMDSLDSDNTPANTANEIHLDLARIPVISRDNTDRNRTSPFAFTGNKFEFRALGSNQSISYPITYLTAAMAAALSEMNGMLKEKAGGGRATDAQVLDVIKTTYSRVKKVCFEKDGYSEAWHAEAEKRGLANLKDTPAALSALKDRSMRDMLVNVGVFGKEDEIDARYNVLIEQYNLIRLIELETQMDLVSSHVIPAATRQLTFITAALEGQEEILGKVPSAQKKLVETISQLLDAIITQRDKLASIISKTGSVTDDTILAKTLATDGMAVMTELNSLCNELELHVDDDLWSLPKYRELIYSV